MRNTAIDLRLEHLELVRRILRTHVPRCTVWVFGSRATGKAKPMSDLDLAIEGRRALDLVELGALGEAFEESDLPMKVDIVDLSQVNHAFRRIIDEQKQRVQ